MSNLKLETLILDKIPGKENICVKPKYQMYDHQIDGIRFIFKKWKSWKNKSQIKPSDYCVLSFPPERGKSATVLSFLYAVRAQILHPILILCKDEGEVRKWRLNLRNWTNFSEDDIAVDSNKALIGKQIFIKKYSDVSKLGPFLTRSWSVVVIKSEECVILPHFHHVEFTIWITSTDISKNLSLLKCMHKWILPKVELKMHTETKTLRENEILKHSVLESFALIRTANSLRCYEKKSCEMSLENKRIKNKDATGLKVKRSKKTHENNEKLDVETFIRNAKPVRSKHKEINEYDFKIEDNPSSVLLSKSDMQTQILNTRETVVKEHIKNTTKSDDIEKNVTITDKSENSTETDICNIKESNCVTSTDNISGDKVSGDLNLAPATPDEETIKYTTQVNTYEEIKDVKAFVEQEESQVDSDIKSLEESNGEIPSENMNVKITSLQPASIDTDVARVKTNNYDLDSKLNEMEEKAMQKFKGSFLDSIF